MTSSSVSVISKDLKLHDLKRLDLKFPLPEPLHSIGLRWIKYAQGDNDFSFAIWSALQEVGAAIALMKEEQGIVQAKTKVIAEWLPKFEAESQEEDDLVTQFCEEIAGTKGKKPSFPDPVRLLQMAEMLYWVERNNSCVAPVAD